MLAICVESIVQKLQQQGIVLRFEKYGPDPIMNPGISQFYDDLFICGF